MHVAPPEGTRGYEVEKAVVNILMTKRDKGGYLYLTGDALIYHGRNISFHVLLCNVTSYEASAGIFESPFLKLCFHVGDEDRMGTIKLNIKGQAFDEFAVVFPGVYAQARSQPPPQQESSSTDSSEPESDRQRVPPYPNVVPSYPGVVPPYPAIPPGQLDTQPSTSANNVAKDPYSQAQMQTYKVTSIVAPGVPFNEALSDHQSLLDNDTLEPAPVSGVVGEDRRIQNPQFHSIRVNKDNRGVGTNNGQQDGHDRIYNPSIAAQPQPKKQLPEPEETIYMSGFPVAK